ncbi:hypothetical protein LTR62_006070 [Meristemomyces frigidus]|uniref:Fatty acid hydroxylase domain-containing protein n=1 Tax=Meristemomyces frigidus TaxID=1508187 RepID=A0AAN7TE00_9PEZI|nr:hypothetical protein LTR62_006070 [Meristemomyces frigidus]
MNWPTKAWHSRWQHSITIPFSLVAAYDHPINYLLAQWLPLFVPAYLFRYHVLEWHIFLAVASFEDLFVYSGYAVLPSAIILPGMARRTEAHFESVKSGRKVGNFGQLGVLDLCCGTTCSHEGDVVEDAQSEVRKHRLQERAGGAVKGAFSGLLSGGEDGSQSAADGASDVHDRDAEDDEIAGGKPRQRRSGRRTGGRS